MNANGAMKACLAITILVVVLVRECHGHAWMSKPKARGKAVPDHPLRDDIAGDGDQGTYKDFRNCYDGTGLYSDPQEEYEEGQVITVRISKFTPHHSGGWHELSLCPNYCWTNGGAKCFERHKLEAVQDSPKPGADPNLPENIKGGDLGYTNLDGIGELDWLGFMGDEKYRWVQPINAKFPISNGEEYMDAKFKLPDGFSCEHCVLQWKWITCDPAGRERFFSCADIKIRAKSGATNVTTPSCPKYTLPSNYNGYTEADGCLNSYGWCIWQNKCRPPGSQGACAHYETAKEGYVPSKNAQIIPGCEPGGEHAHLCDYVDDPWFDVPEECSPAAGAWDCIKQEPGRLCREDDPTLPPDGPTQAPQPTEAPSPRPIPPCKPRPRHSEL